VKKLAVKKILKKHAARKKWLMLKRKKHKLLKIIFLKPYRIISVGFFV
jgi:hypothetical protein